MKPHDLAAAMGLLLVPVSDPSRNEKAVEELLVKTARRKGNSN
jgi:hypothetical protein